MSAFKDALATDIDDVFLNIDEFGEEHDLNGITCTCVIQSPTAREMFLSGKDYENYDAVIGDSVVVHVSKLMLGEVPAHGERFDVDGEIYRVDSCVDDMGMLSITLHGTGVGEPL